MNLEYFINNAPDSIKKSFIYKKYPKGSTILFPGEENNYLFILVSGKANVIVQNLSGAGFVLYTNHTYSCFGELELFNKNAKTFGVISFTDCETIVLHRNTVFEWMKKDFEFTKFLIKQLTEKLLSDSQKLASVSLLNIKDRLLYYIYIHYRVGDLSTLTKATLCSETCIPLRSLNRSIAECKREKYFEFRDKHFHITSVAKLEEYCSSMI